MREKKEKKAKKNHLKIRDKPKVKIPPKKEENI